MPNLFRFSSTFSFPDITGGRCCGTGSRTPRCQILHPSSQSPHNGQGYRSIDNKRSCNSLTNAMNPCTNIVNSVQVPFPLFIKSFRSVPSFKCFCRSSDEKGSDDVKDPLYGLVDKQVQELLSREENKILLDGLEKASQRVEMAKRELELIQKQELAVKQLKDYVNQLEGEVLEIEECQRDISEAKAMVEKAEQSLLVNMGGPEGGGTSMGMKSEETDRDEERWESIKAASISALVGTVSGLPICFTQVTDTTQLLLPLTINFISCALFGVTFRYTIRRNLDDVQLKTGVAAAFGVVKGLGTLSGGSLLEPNFQSFLSHAQDGTIYVQWHQEKQV
ncbi:uncharacterized protein LOC106760172 isoform X2 [Vigna radiata var. radiata]|uniref:Uncharacterized protein LOC106760172 isoform X2 n=1 Tax=Vigna radiata var. radiata TaxID=3916 RepID=A0A1S3TZE1_VIGRR|nr:uncharacterized protein LOC106760172 isoform X2 [Vigna radiata var. radiata]